jgi:hypothetical protein
VDWIGPFAAIAEAVMLDFVEPFDAFEETEVDSVRSPVAL